MAVDSVQVLDTADPHTKILKISGTGDIAINIFLDGQLSTVWHNLNLYPYQKTLTGLTDGNHNVCAQQM